MAQGKVTVLNAPEKLTVTFYDNTFSFSGSNNKHWAYKVGKLVYLCFDFICSQQLIPGSPLFSLSINNTVIQPITDNTGNTLTAVMPLYYGTSVRYCVYNYGGHSGYFGITSTVPANTNLFICGVFVCQ